MALERLDKSPLFHFSSASLTGDPHVLLFGLSWEAKARGASAGTLKPHTRHMALERLPENIPFEAPDIWLSSGFLQTSLLRDIGLPNGPHARALARTHAATNARAHTHTQVPCKIGTGFFSATIATVEFIPATEGRDCNGNTAVWDQWILEVTWTLAVGPPRISGNPAMASGRSGHPRILSRPRAVDEVQGLR